MANGNISLDTSRPLIFGEVLFDHFPDGSRVLGGAPFNVAWHLQGFGAPPLFISRIGEDAPGLEILHKMTSWGMDTKGIQHDKSHPSGTVQITLDDDQPHFDICQEQAYDYIEHEPIAELIANTDLSVFYFGSLIARNPTSRETLRWLCRTYDIPAFVDINIRPPWWTQEEVEWDLRTARWLKLNNDEFDLITGTPMVNQRASMARTLLNTYGCELLIVTLGSEGALLIDSSNELHGNLSAIDDVIDTVGAGDAFSAVTLLGLMRNWEKQRILENALEFAAAICRVRGATVSDYAFYSSFLQRWEN